MRGSTVIWSAMAALVLLPASAAQAQTTVVHQATCMSIRTPAQVMPGQPFNIDVSFRNTGKTDWSGRRLFRVEADHPRWNVIPRSISRTVYAPKTIASFTLEAIAPITPGTYPLVIRMTHRGNPFGTICQKSVRVGQGSSSSSSNSSSVGADISLSIQTPASITRGSVSSLSATVRNLGPETANGVHVILPLTNGIIAATATLPGTCTADASTIVCSLGSLAVQQSRTITIPVTAPLGNTCTPQSVTLSPEAYSREPDMVSTNNRVTTSVTIGCSSAAAIDYSVQIAGPTTNVQRGATINYTVTSQATGTTGTVPSTTVTLTHVSGLVFSASRSASQCRSISATTITCDVQNLQANTNRIYQISFDVPTTLACDTVLNATTTILSPSNDPMIGNNTVPSSSIAVVCTAPFTADVSLTGQVTSTITYGGVAAYTFTVTNAGPSAVGSATISMNMTSALTFRSAGSTPGCTMNGTTLQCSGISLAPSETKTITANFTAPTAGTTCQTSQVSTSATVSFTGFSDPNTANNTVTPLALTIQCPAATGLGTLYVMSDSTPVRSQQLLAGTVSTTIGRFTVRAERENVRVTWLALTATNATSIDSLELYTAGSDTPIAVGRMANCQTTPVPNASFCFNLESTPLIVNWQTGAMSLFVRARIKSDEIGGQSGDPVQVFIAGTATTPVIRAFGAVTGQALTMNNATGSSEGEIFIGQASASSGNQSINFPAHVVTLSRINTIASDMVAGTAVPTGNANLGQFKFTALANQNARNGLNKIRLDGVIFSVQAGNVQIDGPLTMISTADGTITTPCTLRDAAGQALTQTSVTGTFYAECTASNGSLTIDPASTITLSLRGNVTNPKINSAQNSLLQVRLQRFNDPSLSSFGVTQSHIRWTDLDAGTNGATFHWFDISESSIQNPGYQS